MNATDYVDSYNSGMRDALEHLMGLHAEQVTLETNTLLCDPHEMLRLTTESGQLIVTGWEG